MILYKRGYHKLPPLSRTKCDSIISQLEKITFRARTSTHEITGLDYASAGSNIYEAIDQRQIQDIPEVMKISKNPKILSVVKQFLECTPIQTQAACWWTVNYSKGQWEVCAQLFHQDLTYHRFVKLFLYLNDITMENGPHAYVPGSFHNMVTPQEHRMGQRVSDDFIILARFFCDSVRPPPVLSAEPIME